MARRTFIRAWVPALGAALLSGCSAAQVQELRTTVTSSLADDVGDPPATAAEADSNPASAHGRTVDVPSIEADTAGLGVRVAKDYPGFRVMSVPEMSRIRDAIAAKPDIHDDFVARFRKGAAPQPVVEGDFDGDGGVDRLVALVHPAAAESKVIMFHADGTHKSVYPLAGVFIRVPAGQSLSEHSDVTASTDAVLLFDEDGNGPFTYVWEVQDEQYMNPFGG